jgi:hypothetical protein
MIMSNIEARLEKLETKLEKLAEIVTDNMNAQEAAAINVRRQIAEIEHVTTERETSFTVLTWSPKKGDRLGDFEIAAKKDNDTEKYEHALQVLKANNATIQERFYEPQYTHTYWVFNDTPYRQPRKEPAK